MPKITKTPLQILDFTGEPVVRVGEIWKLINGAIICVQAILNVKRKVKTGLNKNLEHHEVFILDLQTGVELYVDAITFLRSIHTKKVEEIFV